ncbi:MAG: hypothetical protein QNJ51_16845 [Calothrix sp. MO_167.B12]|nr:hypothetical protein [Calothrix sp. MO_167.B12]
MKSKLTEKRVYKKPSLNTYGSVKQLTQGTLLPPPVGSDGDAVRADVYRVGNVS